MRKTVMVCDNYAAEISNGSSAQIRIAYDDARKSQRVADLCQSCADALPGRAVARRGRPPKEVPVAV